MQRRCFFSQNFLQPVRITVTAVLLEYNVVIRRGFMPATVFYRFPALVGKKRYEYKIMTTSEIHLVSCFSKLIITIEFYHDEVKKIRYFMIILQSTHLSN